MQIEDIPAGLRLCRLSGWNQIKDDWLAFLDSPDGGGRLAERESVPIGTTTFLRYGGCFSWLSMMLVHPRARHAGVGRQLMDAALDALAGETCICLDATPLGVALYQRFGFSGEYELVRGTIMAPSGQVEFVPDNVRPMRACDLATVFARDRQVFGADRSMLLAPSISARLIWRGQSIEARHSWDIVLDDPAICTGSSVRLWPKMFP